MNYTSCILRNFKCSDYSEPILLKSNGEPILYLLYQEMELMNIINSYYVPQLFGIEYINFFNDHFICYKKSDVDLIDKNKRRILVNNMYCNCQLLSNALWFIKDNAITPYMALICNDNNIEPEMLRRSVYYTNAVGNFNIVEFSKEELKKAMDWYDILTNLRQKKKSDEIHMKDQLTNMSNYISFDTPSFQRAYFYLDESRRTDFLPAKIASYISILECVCVANGDNTQKVSERIAYFIGNDANDRISIYENVKKIYKFRSDYVHGSQIPTNKQETLPELCKIADDIVRKVLSKLFTKHTELNYMNKKDKNNPEAKKNNEVDTWFNELVLRGE